VPILVFLGLSVLELGPMYATDRRQTKASLNASALTGRGIVKNTAMISNRNFLLVHTISCSPKICTWRQV